MAPSPESFAHYCLDSATAETLAHLAAGVAGRTLPAGGRNQHLQNQQHPVSGRAAPPAGGADQPQRSDRHRRAGGTLRAAGFDGQPALSDRGTAGRRRPANRKPASSCCAPSRDGVASRASWVEAGADHGQRADVQPSLALAGRPHRRGAAARLVVILDEVKFGRAADFGAVEVGAGTGADAGPDRIRPSGAPDRGGEPIHGDFRIFATMNPAEYAGRSVLSPAYRNRWRAYRQMPSRRGRVSGHAALSGVRGAAGDRHAGPPLPGRAGRASPGCLGRPAWHRAGRTIWRASRSRWNTPAANLPAASLTWARGGGSDTCSLAAIC